MSILKINIKDAIAILAVVGMLAGVYGMILAATKDRWRFKL